MVFGDPVLIKVSALNLYGASQYSTVGGLALIQLVPDAPVSLQDEPTVTSATQIGISWSEGASNGGAEVIDFTILYD